MAESKESVEENDSNKGIHWIKINARAGDNANNGVTDR